MKSILFILTFFVSLSLFASVVTNKCSDRERSAFDKDKSKVLIVGTGVSGISVATTLLKQGVPGKNIKMVEREQYTGGKVQSFEFSGKNFPMGGQLIVPGNYFEVEDLIKKHNLTTYSMERGKHLDISPGATQGQLIDILSLPEKIKLAEELKDYAILYKARWNTGTTDCQYPIRHPYGFSCVRPELELNWHDFIDYTFPEGQEIKVAGREFKKLDFKVMDKALVSLLGGSGYAYKTYNQSKAGRLVRVFTPELFQALFLNPDAIQIFEDGYQKLWQLEAEELKSSGVEISLNTEVTNIRRGQHAGDLSEVKMTKTFMTTPPSTYSHTDTFNHVFFTATPRALKWIVDDLSSCEQEAFSNIVSSDYRTYLVAAVDENGVLDPTGIPDPNISGRSVSFGVYPYIFGDVNNNDVIGKPVLVAKPFPEKNVYTFYIHGDESVTHQGITGEIETLFKKAGHNSGVRVLNHVNWRYFDRERDDISMKDNFDKVMTFQGRGGLWLTGEYFSFAGTHEVYRISKQFTEMFVNGELGF